MKKLFLAMPNGRFDKIFPSRLIDEIRGKYDVIDSPVPEIADADFAKKYIAEAQIVITSWNSPQMTEEILAAGPKVEFIAHAAGSVKPVVSDAVWKRGIRVTSCAKAIADGVAEFCIGLMLTASKRVFWYSELMKEGYAPRGNDAFGPPFEIYRQNIGLIGAGYVGRKVIELLKPFTCNVLLYDPYVSVDEAADLGVEKVDSIDDIFERSKVVSLHAPTTEETKGMIRGSHFARLPLGALFINTARGIIIREDEMIEELRKGRFIACLDVTDPEPPLLDSPLRSLPNVVLTPHEAGSISENLQRIGELALSEIDAYCEGNRLVGEVTRERLATMA